MSNQEKRQQSVRAVTGTAYTHNEDWLALFALAGITSGTYDDRMLVWCNTQLGSSYSNVNDAMRAFAASQGAASWGEMGTFTTGGGPSGSGMLLEDGLSFLLEEDNDYLILEQA